MGGNSKRVPPSLLPPREESRVNSRLGTARKRALHCRFSGRRRAAASAAPRGPPLDFHHPSFFRSLFFLRIAANTKTQRIAARRERRSSRRRGPDGCML